MRLRSYIGLEKGKVIRGDYPASYYAEAYRKDGLTDGHIMMFGGPGNGNEEAALEALKAYPFGMQVAGGITPDNARKFLDAGAKKVIVMGYLFKDGNLDCKHLDEMMDVTDSGKRMVIGFNCRKKDDKYYAVADDWQKFTDYIVDTNRIKDFTTCCSEFLVNSIDAYGTKNMQIPLVHILSEVNPAQAAENEPKIIITYSGGVSELGDIKLIDHMGKGNIDFTIESAFDIFGGDMSYKLIAQGYGKESKK